MAMSIFSFIVKFDFIVYLLSQVLLRKFDFIVYRLSQVFREAIFLSIPMMLLVKLSSSSIVANQNLI